MARLCRISQTQTLIVALALAAGAGVASAQQPASDGAIATLEAVRGGVTVIRLGLSQSPSPSMPLQRNDVVVTRQGRATVRFHSDGSIIRIGPDSRVQIDESASERDVTVFFGRLWAHVVRAQERLSRFRSGSTIAAIRGTEVSLGVAADGDETQFSVLDGQVEAETDAGSLMLTSGQSAVGRKGSAPRLGVRVRPQDAVQWALYYVPVLSAKPGELGEGPWQTILGESAAAYSKGDLQGAIDALARADVASIRDARFFTYRASLLLATGGVEAAAKDIEHALALAANDSGALALQTIVAVANNDTGKALATGQRAVDASPKSAAAHIALSYARQAAFDLDSARASLETAVQLDPNDALAWARLAEIRSSQGYLDEALEAAQKAVAIEPNLSRTQTVLGFAYLTRVQTAEARAAFEQAIGFDQDDPLPKLGIGLAKIRDGELDEGSRDIEVAVSLDPGASVVRSYLGKAYFEAKRKGLDTREYDVAKEADPNDPTPWFYDAITQQTTNRPVEALESLNEAIERNDNRAVYRSRLLLDSDLAARSASLGRIYTDLGFQQTALVEGWNSVNTDPSNFSAHRLLADSYAARPRHEIARVSELFQSQMLQPLNTTPIQPSLGESNLLLISSQGPAALSFNEFNPLFNRDQVAAQGSVFFGEDDTLAGEGILSGIYKKFSFSAGYSGFTTDGFRENNDQDDKIGNAFVQAELRPGTSVQAEVRHRERENGDLELTFYGDYSPFQRENLNRTSERIGLRHDVGPKTTLLASYMHSDEDFDFDLPDPDFGINYNVDQKQRADSLEGQFLFRSSSYKVVAGGGYFDIDTDEDSTLEFTDPEFALTDVTVSDTKVEHTNLYTYAYLSLPADVTLTLGLSGDVFDQSGTATSSTAFPEFPAGEPVEIPAPVLGSENQFNPKFGLTWSLKSGTTLRAAAFRAFKRTLITDQTLEPTQVAGFNQFFDDVNATESKVYGVAVDQKFGKKVFGGVEVSGRDLTIPFFQLQPDAPPSVAETDGNEKAFRGYLFSIPRNWLAIGVEYQYDDFERNPELFLPYQRLKTHRVPLSARFFHPSGLSAFVGVTFLKQEGEFLTFDELGEQVYADGTKDFAVVDAGLRYRLPRRYGFLVVGANNLTDETQTYQATDPRNLSIRPGRLIYGRVVLAFP